MVLSIIAPRAGESRLNPLSPLVWILAQTSADQVSRFPGNVWSSLKRVGLRCFVFPVLDRERVLGDGARVVRQLRAAPTPPTRQLKRIIPIVVDVPATATLPSGRAEPQAE